MATQTVIASGPPSKTGATLKLRNGSTNALVASAAASETEDGSTVYTAPFTDVAAGTYRLVFVDSAGDVRWTQWVTLAAATATYIAYEVPEASHATIEADIEQIQEDVATILSRMEGILPLSSVANPLAAGYVAGLEDPLVIGDDYTSAVDRLIVIDLVDAAGDPVDVMFGAKTLADAGISIQMLLKPSGKSTGAATLVGTCTYVPAPDVDTPARLHVSLPKTQTALAIPGSYDLQVEAKWTDTSTVTFLPFGKVRFEKDIQRVA